MRTLLVLATLLLLVAPGCGDDTTTTPDMVVSMDMAAGGGGDMAAKVCSSTITCATGCFANSNPMQCANACAVGLDTTSATKFGALLLCIVGACTADGGTLSLQCGQGAVAGPCHDLFVACQTDQG
jgi:hypothetical protein